MSRQFGPAQPKGHGPLRRDRSCDVAELRVVVRDIQPEIWPLVEVPRYAGLMLLHGVLQDVFGWQDQHLFAFADKQDRWYGVPSDEDDTPILDASDFGLHHFVKRPADHFTYIYDWGDNWKHDLTLIRHIESDDPVSPLPYCVAGARAGPHENAGGAEAHMRLCRILADPRHDDYDEVREWLGEDYDFEAFSARQANQVLSRQTAGRYPKNLLIEYHFLSSASSDSIPMLGNCASRAQAASLRPSVQVRARASGVSGDLRASLVLADCQRWA